MATTAGSLAQDEDLKSWYTSLNSIISSYGGSIATLTVPGNNQKIEDTDVNNFYNKITEMKSDTYLKTQTSIYPTYSVVSSGTKIVSNVGTTMSSSVGSSYLGKIKCRNNATNSSGTCQHDTCSHSTNSNVVKGNVNKDNVNHTNSRHSHGTCSNSNNGNVIQFNGGCYYSTCNYSRNFRGTNGFWYYEQGFNSHGTCSHSTNSNVNKSNGLNSHGTHSHGSHSHGTCSHGTCSHGSNSQGNIIDILNAHYTKSNG